MSREAVFKKSICFFAVLFALVLIFPLNVRALVASGTSGSCSWEISDSKELIVKPSSGSECILEDMGISTISSPWREYKDEIESAKFQGKVNAPNSIRALFYQDTNLKSVDFTNFYTTNVTDISYLFYSCTSLTDIKFGNFTTSNVTTMIYTFTDTKALKELDLSNFDTSKVTDMLNALSGFDLKKIKLGPKFSYKKDEYIWQCMFGRGTWRREEDGKLYSVIDIYENTSNGTGAGTYVKVSNISDEMSYVDADPVTYRINKFSSVVFTTTDSNIFTFSNNDLFLNGLTGITQNDYIVPGSASFFMADSVTDKNGNKYDLKVTIDNIHIIDIDKDYGPVRIAHILNTISFYDELSHAAITQDVTLEILNKDGTSAEGTFVFSAYDLDTGAFKDIDSTYVYPDGSRGYKNYSEGVNLGVGFDLSTIKMARNTFLQKIGTNRITGTRVDNATDMSEFLVKANASKSTFTWTAGAGCGSSILSYYQPQIVEIEKRDADGNLLSGALLELYNSNGELIDSWTSGTSHKLFLMNGRYVLKEKEPPAGYSKSDDIEFFVDINDTLRIDGVLVDKITMTDQLNYYGYTVNYLDKETNEKIHDSKIDEMEYGSIITSSDEVIDIDGYIYDSVDKETLTIDVENNVINIYYTKKKGTVVSKFIDKETGEEIVVSEDSTGYIGLDYETSKKIIDGYDFLEVSGSETGTYTEETIEVIYYYVKKPVNPKTIDNITLYCTISLISLIMIFITSSFKFRKNSNN